jgi:membrane-associated phospholipid phosphatase
MRGPALNRGTMKKTTVFILTVLLVLFSYHFVDRQTALFVKSLWKAGSKLSIFSITIPDILFPLVCVITVAAWTAYGILTRKGVYPRHALYFRLVAVAVPVSFLAKSVLKAVVGRVTTRYWLSHQHLYDLHWLHGRGRYTGFPSGHMAVFTVLAIATAKFYPRTRMACWVLLAALAVALILTDYHFVGDVIAGAYLGFLVVWALDAYLPTRSPSPGP